MSKTWELEKDGKLHKVTADEKHGTDFTLEFRNILPNGKTSIVAFYSEVDWWRELPAEESAQ